MASLKFLNDYYEIVRNIDELTKKLKSLESVVIGLKNEIREAVAEGQSTGNKISDFVFRYYDGNWEIEKRLRNIQDKMLGKKGEIVVIISFSEITVTKLENDFLTFEGSSVKIPAKKYFCSKNDFCTTKETVAFYATELSDIIVGDDKIDSWLETNPDYREIVEKILKTLEEPG